MTIMLSKPWEGRAKGVVIAFPPHLLWLAEQLVNEGRAVIVNDPPGPVGTQHQPDKGKETR